MLFIIYSSSFITLFIFRCYLMIIITHYLSRFFCQSALRVINYFHDLWWSFILYPSSLITHNSPENYHFSSSTTIIFVIYNSLFISYVPIFHCFIVSNLFLGVFINYCSLLITWSLPFITRYLLIIDYSSLITHILLYIVYYGYYYDYYCTVISI